MSPEFCADATDATAASKATLIADDDNTSDLMMAAFVRVLCKMLGVARKPNSRIKDLPRDTY